ncbi:diacylglycerol/polyprenol kinase family protein [Hydrogenivirga sp.]
MSIQGYGRSSGRDDLTLELRRQLFHLFLISIWVAPIHFLPRCVTLLLFAGVIALNLLVVYRYEPAARLFSLLIEKLERKGNLERPGVQALYANLGILLSFLLFGKLSVVGVVVLAVGDSVSTLVGKFLGRRKLFFNPEKSWEGTLSFFVSVYGVLTLWLGFEEALIVALFSSLTEALRQPLDDNLSVPLVASALIYLV